MKTLIAILLLILSTNAQSVFPPAGGVSSIGDLPSISQNRVLGRISSGSGAPEELTAANVQSIVSLPQASLAVSGGGTATELWTIKNTTASTGATHVAIVPGAAQGASSFSTSADTYAATYFIIPFGDGNGRNYFYSWHKSQGFGLVDANNQSFPRPLATLAPVGFNQQAAAWNFTSGSILRWSSSASDSTSTTDVSLQRDAAGVLSVYDGSAQGTTAANYRDIKTRHTFASGTAPTISSGFGTTPSIAGSDEAGRVTVGSGGTDQSGVISFGTAYATAPACVANNETTTLLVKATATTTQLTLASASAFTASDKLTWRCSGFN